MGPVLVWMLLIDAPLGASGIEPSPPPRVSVAGAAEHPPGTLAWYETQVRVDRPGIEEGWVVVLGAEHGPFRVLPFAEIVGQGTAPKATGVRRRRRRRALGPSVRVRYPVLVDPRASGAGQARATLVITALGSDRPLGRQGVKRGLRVGRLASTAAEVGTLAGLHDRWLAIAEAARARLPFGELRTDEVTRGPPPSEVQAEDRGALITLSRARIEALAARMQLRAIGLHSETAGPRDAAVEALARLARSPRRKDKRGRTLERTMTGVLALLRDLRLHEASGRLDRVRRGGRLDASELARALVIRGWLGRAEGRASAAATAFGQALCLRPWVSVSAPHPYFEGQLEAARPVSPCGGRALGIAEARAARVVAAGRPALRVEARVENDPLRLAAKALVERLGADERPADEVAVAVAEDGTIRALLSGSGFEPGPRAAERMRVRLTVVDRDGTVLTRLGDPTPLVLDLAAGEGASGLRISPWVWVVAGGVLVAGAAVAGGILLSQDDELQRRVGPVVVDF